MSETTEQGKCTPGPWKIAEESILANLDGWRRDFIVVHSTVYNHGQTALVPNGMGERGEANARLIAAAPELLEACKAEQFVLELESVETAQDKIRLLESVGDYESGWENDWNSVVEKYRTKAALRREAAIAKAEGK